MEIRPIKKSEWPKLLAFNEDEYRPGHIMTNKTYYDWQFDNFTNQNKENYSSLGLFGKSGELLGTFGMFQAPCHFFGKTIMGNCLANLIVRKDLRSLGYGYLLLEEASSSHELNIDHTINQAAWPMFMKAGWQGENLKRHLYIIKPKNNLYELPVSSERKVIKDGWHFDLVNDFGEEINVFWRRIKHRYPITVERSADYLNWRYAHNPLVKYSMFLAKSGEEIKALVVLRMEDLEGENGILGIKAGRIIDFVSDEEAEDFALDTTVEYCRENDVDFLDYFSSGNFHARALKKVGFVDGDSAPYADLPILFHPISKKRTHLNFAVKISNLELPTPNLNDWYTTKGGGDQDRP